MFDHDRDKDLSELIIKKLDRVKDQADRIEVKADRIEFAQKEIIRLLMKTPAPATQISILFSKSQGENMPLTLPIGDTDNFYVFGTAPTLGALLGPGQTISVVSSDPATIILTPDPTPVAVRAADATAAVPAGTPTILSGVVSMPATPAQPNVAIPCTFTVLNSDGSTAETQTDTATASETAATAIGELWGAATPVTSSTAAAKR
jgi:hypothetical protein